MIAARIAAVLLALVGGCDEDDLEVAARREAWKRSDRDVIGACHARCAPYAWRVDLVNRHCMCGGLP